MPPYTNSSGRSDWLKAGGRWPMAEGWWLMADAIREMIPFPPRLTPTLPSLSSQPNPPFSPLPPSLLHHNTRNLISWPRLNSMGVEETKSLSSYGKPPWIFKGNALYQLHLVKAETARAFIPKELKLVEAFGYTLGGFFLASYDDSPAGNFYELVVIAGIVWNRPTSCAWAARVLVSSDEACIHGQEAVGLPSHVARFSKRITANPRQPKSSKNDFLNAIGFGSSFCSSKEDHMQFKVTEVKSPATSDICTINFTTVASALKGNKWMGPAIKLSLPSFSGHTKYNPNLLKYSCKIQCRVRAVKPAKVSGPSLAMEDRELASEHQSFDTKDSESGENRRNLSISVLLSRPILALEFNCLNMQVEAPIIISHCSNS